MAIRAGLNFVFRRLFRHPTTSVFPAEASEGKYIAYTSTLPFQLSRLEQMLATAMAPGIEYTLQVDVGKRSDFVFGQLFNPRLARETAGGTFLAGTAHCTNPGQLAAITLTYTAPRSGAVIDQLLKISLQRQGGSTTTAQANFDKLRLTAVPPPATAWLFGSGLPGLARRGRVA